MKGWTAESSFPLIRSFSLHSNKTSPDWSYFILDSFLFRYIAIIKPIAKTINIIVTQIVILLYMKKEFSDLKKNQNVMLYLFVWFVFAYNLLIIHSLPVLQNYAHTAINNSRVNKWYVYNCLTCNLLFHLSFHCLPKI